MFKNNKIAGVDEVGRGCLAGPVFAAAVILNNDINAKDIKDSKKISFNKRILLSQYIKKNSIYAIGIASVEEIDKKNILNAHIDLFQKMFMEQIKNINYDKIENVFQTSLNIYSLIWDFQYIFREHFESISIDNDILKKINEINNYVENFTEELITKSHNHFLKLKKDALNRLIDTILLIGRYWLHYSKKRYPKSSNENLRKKGTKLIFKSLYPFLNKEGKEKMDLMLSKFDIKTTH